MCNRLHRTNERSCPCRQAMACWACCTGLLQKLTWTFSLSGKASRASAAADCFAAGVALAAHAISSFVCRMCLNQTQPKDLPHQEARSHKGSVDSPMRKATSPDIITGE